MAVYTEISDEALAQFIATYDIGAVTSVKGIAEGVENSNYLLGTTEGSYILTLYEKRVALEDLPFFLGLMEHLAANGLACPTPVRDRAGSMLGRLSERPAAIVTFLKGVSVRRPAMHHCARLGTALAELHLKGEGFALRRPNALSLSGWRELAQKLGTDAEKVTPGLARLIADEISELGDIWPKNLPAGVIHADLFPNNVFFLGDRLSGLIDFYFACNDLLAYDLAVSINAWCFEPDFSFNITKARAMLRHYAETRPLDQAEIDALPTLCRGAALRFLLTRAYDWLHTREDALVNRLDPGEYIRKLRFHQRVASPADYGIEVAR
ncbi:MAG: homoserine kinase [Hyphomicrobiaceae bacterium]